MTLLIFHCVYYEIAISVLQLWLLILKTVKTLIALIITLMARTNQELNNYDGPNNQNYMNATATNLTMNLLTLVPDFNPQK